jgi:hypothetical protein
MTEKELQQILYALKIVFGNREAKRIFTKLVHILFN